MNLGDFRPQAAGDVQPVDTFFEKRVTAGHVFIVPPVGRGFQPPHDGDEVAEHHLADRAIRQQLPQPDRERLVVIVFSDDDDPLRPVTLGPDRLEVRHGRERRLLDEHVFSGAQCLRPSDRDGTAAAPRRRRHRPTGPQSRRHTPDRFARRRSAGRTRRPSRDRGWRSAGRCRGSISGGGYELR